MRVDAIAPESSCDATASYVGTATIHISAADNHTGVAASAWRLDAGEWTTGTVVTTALGGSHTLQFASTDGVGNTEAARTATFTVTVRHEDTAAELTWQKAWTTQTSPVRSGGGWTYTRNAGTGACVNFTGTRIAVVSSVGNSYGIARVLLDGAPAGERLLRRDGRPHAHGVDLAGSFRTAPTSSGSSTRTRRTPPPQAT